MDFSQLSIFPANAAQIHESRRRTFPEWGRGLGLEEHIEREEMLDTKPHATDGKMVIWVLAPRSDPTTIEFYSACETYERAAVTSSGECIAYGIASVFTPSQFRGKGYAKHLMRLLHFVLIRKELLPSFPTEDWGSAPNVPPGLGRGVASALYSDVGSTFYARCAPGLTKDLEKHGWITQGAVGTTWSATSEDVDKGQSIEWIGSEGMEEVWVQDAQLMKREIQEVLPVGTTSTEKRTLFSFLPDGGVTRFQYERNKNFVPSEWTNNRWGVRVSGTEKLAYATWSLDPGREGLSTLIITRLRADAQTFPLIIQAARMVARELSFQQVEVWNLPSELSVVGESLGGITRDREDHLPALAWFGEGDAKWCWNEKFAWC